MPKSRSSEPAEKSIWSRDLGGPSLFPSKVWGVRPGLVVVLFAALAVLCFDQLSLHARVSMPPPAPSPTATPPHFALDDVDLGPRVHLTRFYPTNEIWDGYAVEGRNGRFYVGYGLTVSPAQWGMEQRREVATLSAGRMTAIQFSPRDRKTTPDEVSAELEGLWHGMPVVGVRVGALPYRYVAIGSAGITALATLPTLANRAWPCIAFRGGQVCQVMADQGWKISISLPGHHPVLLAGAPYVDGPPYQGRMDVGEIKLVGGGSHHFLLVEWHAGQDAAECLEGDAL